MEHAGGDPCTQTTLDLAAHAGVHDGESHHHSACSAAAGASQSATVRTAPQSTGLPGNGPAAADSEERAHSPLGRVFAVIDGASGEMGSTASFARAEGGAALVPSLARQPDLHASALPRTPDELGSFADASMQSTGAPAAFTQEVGATSPHRRGWLSARAPPGDGDSAWPHAPSSARFAPPNHALVLDEAADAAQCFPALLDASAATPPRDSPNVQRPTVGRRREASPMGPAAERPRAPAPRGTSAGATYVTRALAPCAASASASTTSTTTTSVTPPWSRVEYGRTATPDTGSRGPSPRFNSGLLLDPGHSAHEALDAFSHGTASTDVGTVETRFESRRSARARPAPEPGAATPTGPVLEAGSFLAVSQNAVSGASERTPVAGVGGGGGMASTPRTASNSPHAHASEERSPPLSGTAFADWSGSSADGAGNGSDQGSSGYDNTICVHDTSLPVHDSTGDYAHPPRGTAQGASAAGAHPGRTPLPVPVRLTIARPSGGALESGAVLGDGPATMLSPIAELSPVPPSIGGSGISGASGEVLPPPQHRPPRPGTARRRVWRGWDCRRRTACPTCTPQAAAKGAAAAASRGRLPPTPPPARRGATAPPRPRRRPRH